MINNESKHLFLISSYPKSGNTLLRIILSSLFFSKDGKTNLEKILIDQLESIDRLITIRNISRNDYLKLNDLSVLYKYHLKIKEKSNFYFSEDFSFFKTHHARINFQNHPYITDSFLRGYIYLIRDPRDVVVSWANHANISIEKSTDLILNPTRCIDWSGKNQKFPETIKPLVLISNWENHVKSWTSKSTNVPKMIIKFEDLITKKELIILDIIDFFKKNYGIKILNLDQKIKNILETTNFDYLQKMEEKYGFGERLLGKFFNKGIKNQWLNILTKEQSKKIKNKFISTMTKYGYL